MQQQELQVLSSLFSQNNYKALPKGGMEQLHSLAINITSTQIQINGRPKEKATSTRFVNDLHLQFKGKDKRSRKIGQRKGQSVQRA